MDKKCLFNINKLCDDCGQCDVCDLDSNKSCNSCGKCLQMEGVDVKAVKIDEISEVAPEVESISASDILNEIAEEVEVFDDSYFNEHPEDFTENEETWELIDDIDGLNDVLEESDKNDLAQELYPGLIYIKK